MRALLECLVACLLLAASVPPRSAAAGATPDDGASAPRRAIEFCPLAPVIHIYGAQYVRATRAHEELILGMAYMHIPYDHGRSHAPTALLGYRRYLWRGAHLEYQIMPSYNWYWESDEHRYYEGVELWNELRPGWTFDFRLADQPVLLNLQCLIGHALYSANKPASFEHDIEGEELFVAPLLFVGWRF